MTTQTCSDQKLNTAKLRHVAETRVVVVPFWTDSAMPDTPALREVDL